MDTAISSYRNYTRRCELAGIEPMDYESWIDTYYTETEDE